MAKRYTEAERDARRAYWQKRLREATAAPPSAEYLAAKKGTGGDRYDRVTGERVYRNELLRRYSEEWFAEWKANRNDQTALQDMGRQLRALDDAENRHHKQGPYASMRTPRPSSGSARRGGHKHGPGKTPCRVCGV